MKIKLTSATRIQLDFLVARCEGLPLVLDPMGFRKDAPTNIQAGWWIWDGVSTPQIVSHYKTARNQLEGFSPCQDWRQGGAILDRESTAACGRLTVKNKTYATQKDGQTYAASYDGHNWESVPVMYGRTYLEAAMRCYVASKLGTVVEIPDDLLEPGQLALAA